MPLPSYVLICRDANGAGAGAREGAARRPGAGRERRTTPVRRWGERANCWAQEERATNAWGTVLLERPEPASGV